MHPLVLHRLTLSDLMQTFLWKPIHSNTEIPNPQWLLQQPFLYQHWKLKQKNPIKCHDKKKLVGRSTDPNHLTTEWTFTVNVILEKGRCKKTVFMQILMLAVCSVEDKNQTKFQEGVDFVDVASYSFLNM